MGKAYNNPIFQYLFVIYLCIALLMAQASGLHMHVQHDDHSHSSATSGHIVDIHIASTLHDIDTHHHEVPDGSHPAAIDISQDYLVKKTSLLNPLAMFVFFIGIFLCVPRLRCVFSRWRYNPPAVNPYYNFLKPPLRAPPVS